MGFEGRAPFRLNRYSDAGSKDNKRQTIITRAPAGLHDHASNFLICVFNNDSPVKSYGTLFIRLITAKARQLGPELIVSR